MEKLPQVESAKVLMTEAMSWSVMKWLREKKSVRKAADQANAALDQARSRVHERWPSDVKAAYDSLSANGSGARKLAAATSFDEKTKLAARKIKQLDDEALRARADAESTFDQAEKQLSTSMAREGCRKAILSWELHEKAIRNALTL